jgi:GxxExxY protein
MIMHENEIATLILDAAFEIHRALGPGLLESVYEEALYYELTVNRGLHVDRQQSVPVVYKDIKLEIDFRADLIVENKVLIELKSVEKVTNVYKKQTLTYIRLADIKLGLLINFNESLLKNGITRIANNL